MGTWNMENMGTSIVTHKHRLLPWFLLERICAVSDVSDWRIKAKHGNVTVYTLCNKGKVLLRYWIDNFASYMTSQTFNSSISNSVRNQQQFKPTLCTCYLNLICVCK